MILYHMVYNIIFRTDMIRPVLGDPSYGDVLLPVYQAPVTVTSTSSSHGHCPGPGHGQAAALPDS